LGWRPQSGAAQTPAEAKPAEEPKGDAAKALEMAAKGKKDAGKTPASGTKTDNKLTITDALAKNKNNPKGFAEFWAEYRATQGGNVT